MTNLNKLFSKLNVHLMPMLAVFPSVIYSCDCSLNSFMWSTSGLIWKWPANIVFLQKNTLSHYGLCCIYSRIWFDKILLRILMPHVHVGYVLVIAFLSHPMRFVCHIITQYSIFSFVSERVGIRLLMLISYTW